jgi:hypothetical protein
MEAVTVTPKDGHGYVGHVVLTMLLGAGGRSSRNAMANEQYLATGNVAKKELTIKIDIEVINT